MEAAAVRAVLLAAAAMNGGKDCGEALMGLQRSSVAGMGQWEWVRLSAVWSMGTRCWSAGRTRQGALEAAGAAACCCCSQFG